MADVVRGGDGRLGGDNARSSQQQHTAAALTRNELSD